MDPSERDESPHLRFVLFPGESHGWIVEIQHEPFERHRFADRRLALVFAKQWASGNRPSRLVELDEEGRGGRTWMFA